MSNNDVRKQVRKAERDPWNRILSILQDSEWVMQFCSNELPNIPIVPNLRCGAWYVTPNRAIKERGCYFKSTDGHINEWGFSLKRYNLAILSLLQDKGSCVIVDSTRRGKSMPDALSKTIPIWCAVINEASRHRFGLSLRFKDTFRIAEHVISQSERSQILSRMEDWVDDLLDSDLEIPHLDRPLLPIFVSRSYIDSEIKTIQQHQQDYYPVILISASPMVSTPSLTPKTHECLGNALDLPPDVQKLRKESEFVYVQGSGDDEEMWSSKLTPSLLWEADTIRRILETKGNETALNSCLEMIVMQNKIASISLNGLNLMANDVQIGKLGLWFGWRSQSHTFEKREKEKYDLIIHADGPLEEDEDVETNILKLGLESGKRGLNGFRQSIPKVIAAAQKGRMPKSILLCSSEEDGIGYDLNGSLAVCILATCFDEDKKLLSIAEPKPYIPSNLIKDDVQKRLQWISTFLPHAKPPSRKHMLRINEVLLGQDIKAQADQERRKMLYT